MERRGRPQRSIRMAPSSFSYERRLGALVPIWFFELYLFAFTRKKVYFPMAPFSAMLHRFRWRPCGQRKRGLVKEKPLGEGARFRLALVRASFAAQFAGKAHEHRIEKRGVQHGEATPSPPCRRKRPSPDIAG